jgi:tRNA dimethylallyltransferase
MILPVILGPTCIGKTSLALEIAKEKGCDILSIDSRQVFKHLDIGTGKYKGQSNPIKNFGYWEVDGVKIWGYDFLLPNEELNVFEFCNFAREVILKYKKDGKKLILTCGTGFYLDFLIGKISYQDINQKRKQELNLKNLNELKEILKEINPNVGVDWENKVRLITKILSLESDSISKKFFIEGVSFELFYLNASRQVLYENSDLFVEDILIKGVLDEYQHVLKGFGESRALNGLIYKEIKEFLSGKILFDSLKSQIKFSLHSYIRRQQTYFKKMHISYSSEDRKDIAEKIKKLL